MQFVKNGPDIPDALLHRHEDGSVVFFCGAGISYPAQLPGFHDLVQGIYAELHARPDSIEDEAINKKQYDATINLLEHRIPGGRFAVRSALALVLKPNLKKSGATATHKALLALARSRDGNSRLVTTNFDRIFESVMSDRARRIPTFSAPLLPIPKDSKWHGLVYLHGLLPKVPSEKELNKLVVSTGDFGLAYLTERWAARFVSELFRNYVVCFVGYSIDDPVLRYMMDALAADRMLGESTLPAYAFASFETSRRAEVENVWLAKRVTPILYEVPSGTNDHSALHRTLKEWGDTHRDGVNAKEQIVVRHALTRPSASTVEDDFAGRVIWALSDVRGLPAKRFADLDPSPPIEWLTEIWKPRFRYSDLVRFSVTPNKAVDDQLQFALAYRPSPYGLSPWMSLLSSDPRSSNWDGVMFHIARWLVRHLRDPTLIIWVAARGGTIHPNFSALIRKSLADSPPAHAVRTLWGLILSDRVRGRGFLPDLYQWFRDLKAVGHLNATLRSALRALLAPQVTLSKPFRLRNEDATSSESEPTIKHLVDWEVVPASEHVHYFLRDSKQSEVWLASIGTLLSDFTDLLRDAFDLMHDLDGAGELSDLSYIHQPSIAEHPQNQYFQEWTALVELLRDSWLVTASANPRAAYLETERWQSYRYPIFRRFTLFAATYSSVFTPQQSLGWLIEDRGWWLWSSETQREALQLVGHLVPHLAPTELAVLEEVILRGPPREMFTDDITDDQWQSVVDNSVWLRLAKWRDTGVALLPAGEARVQALAAGRPERSRAADDQSEFSFWMGSGQDWREFVPAPVDYRDLPDWLSEHPSSAFQQRDDWQDRCKATFRQAVWALLTLAKRGTWLPNRWSEALQAWSDDQLRPRSWLWVRTALAGAPDEFIRDIAHSIIWWMRPMADGGIVDEDVWLGVIGRVFAVYRSEPQPADDDPVERAINHPVGQATEAVLHFWYRQELADNQRLPDRISSILSLVSERQVEAYRHGRVILAQAVITLFRVDRDWTVRNVLPLFDWSAAHGEARFAWEGFLWTPRMYFPFLEAIKVEFLATAAHYGDLRKHSEQYAAFLTFTALEPGDAFSRAELAAATAQLPPAGLVRSARALLDAIKGSGDQAPEYWRNRILPYINDIWPKTVALRSNDVSTAFAQICIAAGNAFPEAYSALRSWLQALTRPDHTVTLLNEAKLCGKYPGESLGLLDAIIGDRAEWAPHELATCLAQIEAAESTLAQDTRFRRLLDYARQHNLGS